MDQCETCMYFEYDEELEDEVCVAPVDMDDLARLIESRNRPACPFYRPGDEYTIVRKQN